MAAVAAMMMLYPTIRRMPRQSQKVRHLWQDATFITISPMAWESPRCVDREHTTITAITSAILKECKVTRSKIITFHNFSVLICLLLSSGIDKQKSKSPSLDAKL